VHTTVVEDIAAEEHTTTEEDTATTTTTRNFEVDTGTKQAGQGLYNSSLGYMLASALV
jgi:hypothetical protein